MLVLIQDNQSASKTKHIVFDSDGEGEAVVCKRSKEEVTLGNVLKNVSSIKTGAIQFQRDYSHSPHNLLWYVFQGNL